MPHPRAGPPADAAPQPRRRAPHLHHRHTRRGAFFGDRLRRRRHASRFERPTRSKATPRGSPISAATPNRCSASLMRSSMYSRSVAVCFARLAGLLKYWRARRAWTGVCTGYFWRVTWYQRSTAIPRNSSGRWLRYVRLRSDAGASPGSSGAPPHRTGTSLKRTNLVSWPGRHRARRGNSGDTRPNY